MKIIPYIKVFRVDHWIKNIFTVIGSFGAVFFCGLEHSFILYLDIIGGVLLSCFISSVNYVINEILDASFDALHPAKKHRPIPSGQITLYKLIVSAVVLLSISLILAESFFNRYFNISLLFLFISGLVYNVRPVRAKDIPFVDVIVESVNNPIRLFIGWYATGTVTAHPPYETIIFFWSLGAFLMTAKRIAELKLLTHKRGALYRPTFKYYTVLNLTVAFISHAIISIGAFLWIAHTHMLTLHFSFPLYIIFILWYFKLTYEEDSIVMYPEHAYKRPLFCLFALFSLLFTLVSLIVS